MRREPTIQRIKPDADGRVLDRRRIRAFYLLILPILLPISSFGAGAFVLDAEFDQVIGGSLIGMGVLLLVAYCVYDTCLINLYPARCYLRWLRERIDLRPNAIVASDDPRAFFVQIIPRENWRVSLGENAADVGLLVVDKKNDELRYEGDLERWTVPAECVRSFRLESFTPPAGLPAIQKFTVVMLVVEMDDREIWETPLAAHHIHFELWTGSKRRRGVELLRRVIGNLVDSKKWPAVENEELWPLRPPNMRAEEEDFGETLGR
jgi:hypothetical protein